MGELSLAELLDAQSLAKLTNFKPDENTQPKDSRPEKSNGKNKVFLEILREDPDFKADITQTFQKLSENKIPLPIAHVTSSAVRHEDGTITSTGYIENIEDHGFRARDTNVAAFVERGSSLHIASPEYLAENPHMFLRGLTDMIQRYKHHGLRTNKDSLGDGRDQGVGLPAMLLIDSRGVKMVKGTDYDDHFMLYNQVPPTNILGIVDLKEVNPRDNTLLKKVAKDVLSTINNGLEVK